MGVYSSRPWTDGLIKRLETEAMALLASSPACHDWDHTLRVRRNAMMIAEAEGADKLVVEAAAILHDVGRPAELMDEGKTDHAELGASMVPHILKRTGVDDTGFIEHVAACVLTHRFRKRHPERIPATLEAKTVFDADKLDSMGAIGIARSFHFAGRVGARVHNTETEALNSDSYSHEDTAYREYLVKLRFLKDAMLTNTGRIIALNRHDFMKTFFHELNTEAF